MFKYMNVINSLNINESEFKFFASSNIQYVVVNILTWMDFQLIAE